MKLEKREISLNERDSLREALYMQKALLYQYVDALCESVRKQTRGQLSELLGESCKDLILLLDYARECEN